MLIRYIYKFVCNFRCLILNALNFLELEFRGVHYGKNLNIKGRLMLFGHGNLYIGDNVTINSNINFNPIGGMSGVIINVGEKGCVRIGNGSGLSNSAIVSYCSVDIGENVFIGGNCVIYDTDFHSLNLTKRIADIDDDINSKPVVIKDGAFIGGSSIILKGVTIGKESIVGAGSVVTHNIPDGEIWGGNPAQFIRRL